MFIKSITDDVYTRRLLKGKYGDQFDILRANPSSIQVSRWSYGGGGRVSWCQDSRMKANGFSNPKPKRREPSLIRSRAILTPVSDPAPTTKKVCTTTAMQVNKYF